jgi:ATP synthase protein I
MHSGPSHSGEMSQNSEHDRPHRNRVDADASTDARSNAAPWQPAIDPAARRSRRLYNGLSASSAGLELGIAVGLGAFGGRWLDGKLGSEPWMLLVGLVIGLIAGFRGVLRAVARAERAERDEKAEHRG